MMPFSHQPPIAEHSKSRVAPRSPQKCRQGYLSGAPTNTMSTRRATALFLFMGVAFGGAFPAIKAGLADAPPLLFAALRYDLAALLLLAYAAFVLGNWRPRLRADWLAVLAGGVLFIGSSGFLYLGQQYTTAGVSAIIYSLGPILTVVFAWVLLPAERLSRRALIGVLIGLVGVALVVRPTPEALFSDDFRGRLLVLTAISGVTLGSIGIRRSGSHMPAATTTGLSLALGGAVLHVGSLLSGEPQAVFLTPTFIGSYLYLAVVATTMAFVAYFSLLDRVGPHQANLVVYVVPIVATIVGWVWLGESLPAVTLAGFLVIFGGFLVVKWTELSRSVQSAWLRARANRP